MTVNKLLLGLSLCGVILSTGALSAVAAPGDGGVANTKGSIDFIPESNPGGVIVKPETDDEIIPEGGASTTGNLRIQYVPDFDFGKNELTTGKQVLNSKYMAYKYTDKNGMTDQYFMPQFVQVSDTRGTNEGFLLTVKASVFQREGQSADTLPNTKITLLDGRLSNTVYDQAMIASKINTFKGEGNQGTGQLVIPNNGQAVTVMTTKSNDKEHTTNGTQTSLLLSKTYLPGDHSATATTENTDVILTKENTDIATVLEPTVTDPYKAKITWTLTDAK